MKLIKFHNNIIYDIHKIKIFKYKIFKTEKN